VHGVICCEYYVALVLAMHKLMVGIFEQHVCWMCVYTNVETMVRLGVSPM
jgi:spore germination protein YaaH